MMKSSRYLGQPGNILLTSEKADVMVFHSRSEAEGLQEESLFLTIAGLAKLKIFVKNIYKYTILSKSHRKC